MVNFLTVSNEFVDEKKRKPKIPNPDRKQYLVRRGFFLSFSFFRFVFSSQMFCEWYMYTKCMEVAKLKKNKNGKKKTTTFNSKNIVQTGNFRSKIGIWLCELNKKSSRPREFISDFDCTIYKNKIPTIKNTIRLCESICIWMWFCDGIIFDKDYLNIYAMNGIELRQSAPSANLSLCMCRHSHQMNNFNWISKHPR